MSDKIMLLDGHSLLNRAFYGLPDLTNAEGKHTNAVLGFLNIMLRYVISPISSCEMMFLGGNGCFPSVRYPLFIVFIFSGRRS